MGNAESLPEVVDLPYGMGPEDPAADAQTDAEMAAAARAALGISAGVTGHDGGLVDDTATLTFQAGILSSKEGSELFMAGAQFKFDFTYCSVCKLST